MRFLAAARSRRTVAVGALLAASLIGGPAAGLASAEMGDAHPVAAPSAFGLELSFAPRVADLGGLAISRWSYKTQGEAVRHLGPMAEDFHAAFGLGSTPSAISVVDVAGVALAAARELALRLDRLEAEVRGLERDNHRLERELARASEGLSSNARLRELERRLARIEGGRLPIGAAASR